MWAWEKNVSLQKDKVIFTNNHLKGSEKANLISLLMCPIKFIDKTTGLYL